jgi:hypothetical protein
VVIVTTRRVMSAREVELREALLNVRVQIANSSGKFKAALRYWEGREDEILAQIADEQAREEEA